MNDPGLIREYLRRGPKDAYQQLILVNLLLNSNDQGHSAVSPLALSHSVGISERTVRNVLKRLSEMEYLRLVSEGKYQILGLSRARVRACAPDKENYLNKDITLKNNVGADQHQHSTREDISASGPEHSAYRSHSRSTSAPIGTGQSQSLGVDNCPKCDGTGWQLVTPSGPWGQETVDICTCRGGPQPSIRQRAQLPTQGLLSEQQRAANTEGISAIREVLSDDTGQHQTRPAGESLDQAKEPDTDQG